MAVDVTKFGHYVESFNGELYVNLKDYEQIEELYYHYKQLYNQRRNQEEKNSKK